MTGERKSLDFDALEDFQPRPGRSATRPDDRKAIDRAAAFPSRETPDDAQLNIKAPAATLERFRSMARAERYKHGAFLEILMDAYDRSRNG